MQTYYDLGYIHALEKLGMVGKDAGLKDVIGKGVQFAKNIGRPGSAATKRELGYVGEQLKVPKGTPSLQGSLSDQAARAGMRAPKADPVLNAQSAPPRQRPMSREQNWQEYQTMPQGRGFDAIPTPKGSPPPSAGSPPKGNKPPKGKTQQAPQEGPVVQSKTTPAAKQPETKANEPGFLRKHWLPIAAGTGLAGLGGYAYLKNRDPMGSSQLPSGYGAPGGYGGGGFNG